MANWDDPVYFKSGFVQKLTEALGIPDCWRRVIIDIKFDDVATLYIERLMDESELTDIDIEAGITWERPARSIVEELNETVTKNPKGYIVKPATPVDGGFINDITPVYDDD